MIAKDTTLGAARFITATTTIEAEMRAVELTATGGEILPAAMKGTGLPMRTLAAVAELKTVPDKRPGLLKETITPLADMRNPAVRAERARAPSAVTTMAERQGTIPHAAAPAWAAEREAEGDLRAAVVVAGTTNQSFALFLAVCKI
jgi:hypothetical protein